MKCQSFRPILSAIKTFIETLTEPIIKNNFTVKKSFLIKYVNKIQNNLWPVLTLSTSSPIYRWRKLLKSVVTHFIRIKNCCLTSIKISLRNSTLQRLFFFFFFDCIVYEQVDEEIWINNCLDEFNPVYYKKYVDDTFVLFRSAHYCDKFNEYLNEKHANINWQKKKRLTGHYHFQMC